MYKFKFKYLYIRRTIVALFIICLIPMIIIFTRNSEEVHFNAREVAKSNPKVSYIKDNKLYYINNHGKVIFLCNNVYNNEITRKDVDLSGNNYYEEPNCVFIDEKQTVYFFGNINIENGVGTLYQYTENQKIKQIDTNVLTSLELSPDHNKIAYKKFNNMATNNYDLYIYEFNKEKQRVLKDIDPSVVIAYSLESNTIAWVEKQDKNILYIKTGNKNKLVIDSSSTDMQIIKISENGKLLEYSKPGTNGNLIDIYFKHIGGSTEKVSGVQQCSITNDDFSFFYIGDSVDTHSIGDLFYKQLNKAPIKLTGSVYNIINILNAPNKTDKILFQKFNGDNYITDGKKVPLKVQRYNDGDEFFISSDGKALFSVPQIGGDIKEATLNKSKNAYEVKTIEDKAYFINQNPNYYGNESIFLYTKQNQQEENDFYSLNLDNGNKNLIQENVGNVNMEADISRFTSVSLYDITRNNLVKVWNVNSPTILNNNIYYSSILSGVTNLFYNKLQSKSTAKEIAGNMVGFVVYDEKNIYYSTAYYEKGIKFNLYKYKPDGNNELVAEALDQVIMAN